MKKSNFEIVRYNPDINIGLTKKELCALLNYGNTMMSEFLGILKHHDLIIDTNIQKHYYYKINLITLKKLC